MAARRGFLLVLVLAGVGMLIAGIMMLQSPSDAASVSVGQASLVPGASSQPVQEGTPAPDFQVRYADGRTFRLSDLRGQPVMVNFWATWCTFCKAETPTLQQAYQKYQADGFRLIAINDGESVRKVEEFAARYGLTFDLAIDSSGDISRRYRVSGIPASFFIDRDGIVQEIYVGQILASDMERLIGLIK